LFWQLFVFIGGTECTQSDGIRDSPLDYIAR